MVRRQIREISRQEVWPTLVDLINFPNGARIAAPSPRIRACCQKEARGHCVTSAKSARS